MGQLLCMGRDSYHAKQLPPRWAGGRGVGEVPSPTITLASLAPLKGCKGCKAIEPLTQSDE
ncbi:hypothetical protein COCOBI_pt-1520 (chloroplast) [Coccomyxa sp. Obi]|nr:hypothetical protein COCOBI_pt-1520 [Coccomyxa sp. Obi]